MYRIACILGLCVLIAACRSSELTVDQLAQDYISEWIEFYPTRAFAAGHLDSAHRFESISRERIKSWVEFNQAALTSLEALPIEQTADEGADADLLRRQILDELDRWGEGRSLEASPMYYVGLVSQALTHILARDDLEPEDKFRAIEARLAGIRTVCAQGTLLLKDGRPRTTERSIPVLEASARFLEANLVQIAGEWTDDPLPETFVIQCERAADDVRTLAAHIQQRILPAAALPDSMGRRDYAKKLEIFTGTNMTPEELAKISLQEIKEVRGLMQELAGAYWIKQYPRLDVPEDFSVLVGKAIDDMEGNRESNQQDFLKFFECLIGRAEEFVRDQEIATLPAEKTLFTALSPSHFAGAAVGGVYAAGPFNPGAKTLFYLPTILDDASEEAKEGFYRSFNNHFNTMIITHEIFPGHYMQSKLVSTNPHLVRALFSDGLYVEGWATLCEVITLDAGWNGSDPLDRLAHLRKRLENATRSYTSVQVHCFGWGQKEV
ncbi:MAG: DUF885 family protein, partial [Candidatus Aminicenantaceae bacterium]